MRRNARQHAGFTMLEILVSVTLMVSIFIIVVSGVANALKENRDRQMTISATDHANTIVRSLVSLLRQAEPSATGAYPIAAASSTSLTFYTATKGSTAIQQARIFLDGTSLKLGQTPPTGSPPSYPAAQEVVTTVLTDVHNGSTPLFQYYDGNYTGTQSAMNPISLNTIRIVKLSVLYDQDPAAPPNASTIELLATLRNLKDNY